MHVQMHGLGLRTTWQGELSTGLYMLLPTYICTNIVNSGWQWGFTFFIHLSFWNLHTYFTQIHTTKHSELQRTALQCK
jgi:hypothetical protein